MRLLCMQNLACKTFYQILLVIVLSLQSLFESRTNPIEVNFTMCTVEMKGIVNIHIYERICNLTRNKIQMNEIYECYFVFILILKDKLAI